MNEEKLKLITIPFHLSVALYFILGVIVIVFSKPFEIPFNLGLFLGIFSITLGILIEIVIYHLKKGKYWAWIVSIVICGFYIPSLYIVFGVPALIGLISKDTRDFINKK